MPRHLKEFLSGRTKMRYPRYQFTSCPSKFTCYKACKTWYTDERNQPSQVGAILKRNDLFICKSEFIVWIMKRVYIVGKSRTADDVKRHF